LGVATIAGDRRNRSKGHYMTDRMPKERLYELRPELRRSLTALGAAAEAAGLDKRLIELIKLRASEINGCAFCLHMHAGDARKLGESQERLDVLSAWREAGCFSAREQAALAWTEALTLIADHERHDPAYAALAANFSEAEIAGLTAAILAINGWNRLAIGFHMQPKIGG
jgi:AhpD family alkylhydroperoxidase